jgi:RHS repeat-associated protein
MSGSLAKLVMPATVSSATYDAANRISNWGGTSLSYDANGSLTAYGATTYNWNARNELTATSEGSSTFSYDATGRRRTRTVWGVTTAYLHDGRNPATVGGDVMLAGQNVDEFYAQITGGIPVSYLQDALGSTVALTDVAGAVSASYAYGVYGDVAKTGSGSAAFQFTARERDLPGLQFNRARYFNPATGRFISEDPAGLSGGTNLYAYASGNPVEYSDPSGECPWCIGFGIGAGFDLVMQLAQNGGNFSCVSWGQVLASGAVGTIGGGIGGKGLSGILKGLGMTAKGRIGEGLSILENRLAGSRLLEAGTKSIDGQRTIVDSTWRSIRGIKYYVESKFGGSRLSTAQKAAQKALGDDLYRVERWGYSFFERVGAYIGGTERAVSEQAALPPPGESTTGEGCDKCK